MDELGQYRFNVRLAASADHASLLRLVSVLHGRHSEILDLTFRREGEGETVLTGTLELGNLGEQSLQAALRRPIHVLEASVAPLS